MNPAAGMDPSRKKALADSMLLWQDDLVEALRSVCSIQSIKGEKTANAPFGEQTRLALEVFLEIGRNLGFRSVNLDQYAGYVEMGEGDRLVAALCHLDVVPAGEGWTTDPFLPVIVAGKMIGRGTSDDKGPAIAVLFAMKALLDSGYQPLGRIRLIVGLDEESGSKCMAHYVRVADLPLAGFTPDASFPVIYAEKGMCQINLTVDHGQTDTDALRLTGGMAGERANVVPGSCCLTFTDPNGLVSCIQVEGKPAHASTPWNGRNAISLAMEEAAARLAAAGCSHPFVDFYRKVIGMDWDGRGLLIAGSDESGPLTLNAGIFHLDERTAGVTLDIRYPVTWSYAEIAATVGRRAAELGGSAAFTMNSPPLHEPTNAPLVMALTAVYHDLTGLDSTPVAIGGGTYARSMPNIVAFGASFPDDMDAAHQAGESVDIGNLLAASAIFREALVVLDRLAEKIPPANPAGIQDRGESGPDSMPIQHHG